MRFLGRPELAATTTADDDAGRRLGWWGKNVDRKSMVVYVHFLYNKSACWCALFIDNRAERWAMNIFMCA